MYPALQLVFVSIFIASYLIWPPINYRKSISKLQLKHSFIMTLISLRSICGVKKLLNQDVYLFSKLTFVLTYFHYFKMHYKVLLKLKNRTYCLLHRIGNASEKDSIFSFNFDARFETYKNCCFVRSIKEQHINEHYSKRII